MKATQDYDYDVVIAGGGMIGSSLALALAPLQLRVAVVEPVHRQASGQPSFDDRSTALSRSTQRTFEAMGLWRQIADASTPIKSIHISDRGRFGFSHIDAVEQNVEALGYVVINRVLGNVLASALSELDSLDWICPAHLSGVTLAADTAHVVIDDGKTERQISCKLLVAADGASSSVRDMIGISAERRDYQQFAVIGNLLPEMLLNNRAFERFTEHGPVALLPVADNRAAFVWMMSPDAAEATLELSDEQFIAQIQQAFGFRLGEFSRVGKRAAYPLALTQANGLTSRRSVVVGNAAHGLHPVAAQGFNLGMRDVAALCDCILDARARGIDDPGSTSLLEEYAEWRGPDQRRVVHFTDSIVKLFGSSAPPVRMLRNAAMLGFDLVPGIRSIFAKYTMGLAGRLPRLSRGIPLE